MRQHDWEHALMMKLAELGAKAIRQLPPELAHTLTVKMLAAGLGPRIRQNADPRLITKVAGISFPNPIGLAAGFDKNAEAPDPSLDLGFGFVEVGAVTPRAQPGNDRPRVFRLAADRAVINRYGFNNEGLAAMTARLAERAHKSGVVGVNLGANKTSEDRVGDYIESLLALGGLAAFFTVNISSPNTPGLRALQGRDALDDLLARVNQARQLMKTPAPIFLKIAPDLTDEDKADIVSAVIASSIDALIVSNTTISRPDFLQGAAATEAGGLSGAPLFQSSTALLAEFAKAFGGKLPLIGVGGVASPEDAYEKILRGASLVQIYTAMIYEGPGLPSRIVTELPALLEADGFETIADAVGAKL